MTPLDPRRPMKFDAELHMLKEPELRELDPIRLGYHRYLAERGHYADDMTACPRGDWQLPSAAG